ncbi:deoxyguanosinetriphosphate triphosphohydrolase family protein [Rhizobium rhizogenes]|uniref:deoxyguanosinetriphosphate triphosphohydrolase family protein n=1 Tax=Rhizobium rhizogenes TaxID=359 RepID=UPI002271A158|nr:dNTP triphosphohydrolase [Rhizobium rhizogenes]
MPKVQNRLYNKTGWNRVTAELGKAIEKYRIPSRKDYARLIHSPSFRRLQGKTQLYPSHESDFFRNRLTHSLEVAQIAKSIAMRLNSTENFLFPASMKIDENLVEFAGLAHDLGHPPFGHNGEKTLDRLMIASGGFEGNAQTLRILSRLEKKETRDFPSKSSIPSPVDQNGGDIRRGLNLTYRTLASIVKYNKSIPVTLENRKASGTDGGPVKGIYSSEVDLLNSIKEALEVPADCDFKTIECSIMDVADDIAYSTYDVEDSLKAGFLSPLRMISMPDEFKERIVVGVRRKINEYYSDSPEDDREFSIKQLNDILANLFRDVLLPADGIVTALISGVSIEEAAFMLGSHTNRASNEIADNGYLRTALTSQLVGEYVQNIELISNEKYPVLSRARLKLGTFKKVETLKRFAYELLISSPRLKIAEKRGDEIISKIFSSFMETPELLPEDWQTLHRAMDDSVWKQRVVCDYIAGMTDRYCVEVYSRLTGENPMTIWKPH